jgi:hypothetical protein
MCYSLGLPTPLLQTQRQTIREFSLMPQFGRGNMQRESPNQCFGIHSGGFAMVKLLRRHVMPELAARRFAWGTAFVIGTACTALVLKMLPEFGVWASIGLVSGVALGWVVLGTQFPRMIFRAEPDRRGK